MSTAEIALRPDVTKAVTVREEPPQDVAMVPAPRDPYEGIASQPFPPKAQEVLGAKLLDEDIEIRPDDGMLYLPGVRYRLRLNEAFGLGGWGLRPKGEPKVNGNQVFYTGQLYCLGRFVAEAMGEGKWISSNPKSSYGTALESAKTDALTRCCKDIGVASQLWDPSFTRRWKHDWAVNINNPDRSRFGGVNTVWVRVDDPCYAPQGKSRDDAQEPPVDPGYRATIQDSRPGLVVPPPPSPRAGSTSAAWKCAGCNAENRTDLLGICWRCKAPQAGSTSREGAELARSGLPAPSPSGVTPPKAEPQPSPGPARTAASSPAAATTSIVPATSASPTPSQAKPKPKHTGANSVGHDGVALTMNQLGKLHALRGQLPKLAATPDDPNSAWKGIICVYPQPPGETCTVCKGSGDGKTDGSDCKTCKGWGRMCAPTQHSTELSKQQASHLIQRMEEALAKQQSKEAEIRSGTTGEVVPGPKDESPDGQSPVITSTSHGALTTKNSATNQGTSEFDNPVNWAEFIHGLFPTATEEDAYFADFHSAGGYASAEEVPESSRQMVGLLIASVKMGPGEYKKAWNIARAMGHLPGFQP